MPSNGEVGSSSAGARGRKRNASRLTCVNCRQRKIRCDGAQPECGICAAYNKQCNYDKPPPMSQVIAMTEKIRELESTVERLTKSATSTATAPEIGAGDRVQETENASMADARSIVPRAQPSLSVNDAYYESTSAVDAPIQADPGSVVSSSTAQIPGAVVLESLTEQDISRWEETAISNCAMLLQLPTDKVRHLLSTHWAWIHPVFMFVNKPLFLRDACTGGEYFSPLLLTVICLHSTRFTDQELAERLSASAKLLLNHEIHAPPSITLVESLLQLSAREIGNGGVSQAWLYSGMAFRLATDMGVFKTRTLQGASADAVRRNEVHHRLAWSCYLWDKAISLYLGRGPTLVDSPRPLPGRKSCVEGESSWIPYGVRTSFDHHATSSFQSQICFSCFCKLAEIISDILCQIYGAYSNSGTAQFVKQTRQRLEDWKSELPDSMRLGTTPFEYPNPHVLTQHLLYHGTTILLLRPFRRIAPWREACRQAANSIEAMFLNLERTSGFQRVTYMMAYCAYLGATIAVQDANEDIGGAHEKIETFVRVLSAICYTCPGMQRSLNIIAQCLRTRPASKATRTEHHHLGIESTMDATVDSIMPTFPISDYAFIPKGISDHVPNPFADLDAYTMQWESFSEDMIDDFLAEPHF